MKGEIQDRKGEGKGFNYFFLEITIVANIANNNIKLKIINKIDEYV